MGVIQWHRRDLLPEFRIPCFAYLRSCLSFCLPGERWNGRREWSCSVLPSTWRWGTNSRWIWQWNPYVFHKSGKEQTEEIKKAPQNTGGGCRPVRNHTQRILSAGMLQVWGKGWNMSAALVSYPNCDVLAGHTRNRKSPSRLYMFKCCSRVRITHEPDRLSR